jgi:DNA-binding CsgD family transcriptional regulator
LEHVHLSWQGPSIPPNFDDVLREVRDMARVDHATFAAIIPGDDKLYSYSTYPEEWVREYSGKGYIDRDPALQLPRRVAIPVDWTTLRGDEDFDEICKARIEFGIPTIGVSIPVRGARGDFGVLSLAKNCTDSEWTRLIGGHVGQFMLQAALFHDSVVRHVFKLPNACEELTPTLSKRELEILSAISAGQSREDVQANLMLSSRAIEEHLKAARLRLAAITPAHAVIRARSYGLIPDPS